MRTWPCTKSDKQPIDVTLWIVTPFRHHDSTSDILVLESVSVSVFMIIFISPQVVAR